MLLDVTGSGAECDVLEEDLTCMVGYGIQSRTLRGRDGRTGAAKEALSVEEEEVKDEEAGEAEEHRFSK